MNIKRREKPEKKTDEELYDLIIEKIDSKNYVFLNHAKQRLHAGR